MKTNIAKLSSLGFFLAASSVPAIVSAVGIDFEDLSFTSGNSENGAHLTGTETVENRFGSDVTVRRSTFTSTGAGVTVTFENEYIIEWGSWSGWSYSKDTDGVTPGFMNQYSAKPASGATGSANYGVAYQDTDISFSSLLDFTGVGLQISNTTYAYDSMLNGDGFSDAFTQGDYYMVSIEGFNSTISQGTIDVYLADYRSANSADHYILGNWEYVDLSALGMVDELVFTIQSSDPMKPTYFALDNIGAVPEPSAYALIAGMLAMLSVTTRRRG